MVIINATSLHIQTQRELRKNFKKSIKVDLKKKNATICASVLTKTTIF